MDKSFAVITGGSSGAGLEPAHRFIEHEYDVLIAAQDGQTLANAAAEPAAPGVEIPTRQCDLATEEAADQPGSAND